MWRVKKVQEHNSNTYGFIREAHSEQSWKNNTCLIRKDTVKIYYFLYYM